jgi:hypothetical protein
MYSSHLYFKERFGIGEDSSRGKKRIVGSRHRTDCKDRRGIVRIADTHVPLTVPLGAEPLYFGSTLMPQVLYFGGILRPSPAIF